MVTRRGSLMPHEIAALINGEPYYAPLPEPEEDA